LFFKPSGETVRVYGPAERVHFRNEWNYTTVPGCFLGSACIREGSPVDRSGQRADRSRPVLRRRQLWL